MNGGLTVWSRKFKPMNPFKCRFEKCFVYNEPDIPSEQLDITFAVIPPSSVL